MKLYLIKCFGTVSRYVLATKVQEASELMLAELNARPKIIFPREATEDDLTIQCLGTPLGVA
jgi:hypothetical protein